MDSVKYKELQSCFFITLSMITLLFSQQTVWADSIYTFWQANKSSNQIFYSASYDGTDWFSYGDQLFGESINSSNITAAAPASASFKNKLYVVWQSNDSYNRIYYSASSDGHTWPVGQSINGSAHSVDAPSIVAFKDNLYVFWRASSRNNVISYISSSDGKNWSVVNTVNYVNATSATPAVTTDGKKLYVFWRENGSNNMYYTESSDGKTWPDHGQPLTGFTTMVGPAATYNKDLGVLYLVWRASDGSNQIIYSTSSDGISWSPQQTVSKYITTSMAPSAAYYEKKVYIAWKDHDSNGIFYTASNDGKTWSDGTPIANDDSTTSAPALASPFSPDLSFTYSCWATDDSGLSWTTAQCCHPDTEYCGVHGQQNFSTGHDNKDPYKGTLDPKQKLQLNLTCGWDRKIEGVGLTHNNNIDCEHSQKEKGIKVYNCQNNSDSHHTWQLNSYKCHAG